MKTSLRACAVLTGATLFAALNPLSVDAATFLFNTDPFVGSTALATPGRQVVGNELFIPDFDFANDVFAFDAAAFGVESLSFQNSVTGDLPSSGVNAVIVRDTDTDNDPLTPFNAGSAANLIAAEIDSPAPGFFIYHNGGLGLNRLVFSTDLSDVDADLKVLARLTSPVGVDAIALMPTISAANFQVVPEPAGAVLAAVAIGGLARSRRVRAAKVPLAE
jgi:hypothetical protein